MEVGRLRRCALALLWTGMVLAGACVRAPEPAADRPAGDDAPAASAPSVTVRGDESEEVVGVWTPPSVDPVPVGAARGDAHRRAAQALEDGHLFEDSQAAVPIYLALIQADPGDRAAARGLQRALGQVLEQARQALAAADEDPEGLSRAEQLAAVARAVAPQDAAVLALQRQVELARRIQALNRAGEDDLRAGRLGEAGDGALVWFGEALSLRPDDPRALQGRAAVESAALRRAQEAAQAFDFDAAATWLGHARAVRADAADAVADAGQRVESVRSARIAALRDTALRELATGGNALRPARERLAEILRIAHPGDAIAGQLRERIDLATHYGAFRPGQVFTDALADGSRGPQMMVVPHGAFHMGALDNEAGAADAEKPAHYVRFDRGFAMSLTEVTVAEFGRFVAQSGGRPRATRRGNSIVYDERSGNFARRSGVDWRSGYDGRPAAQHDPELHVSVRDAEA